MWQQQMTSNHNSSQITQITSLQKKIVIYKSQERRKGSRLDLIFGKTRQHGRTFLQTMDKRWDVYFLKHKNWRTFLLTMEERWPKSHLAPAEKDLALQHRGRGGGRCKNVDICKIISKLTLEYNFIVHLIVLHLLTVGQHGTNLIDWWHSCSKYNLAL